jgi:hypothetical protein
VVIGAGIVLAEPSVDESMIRGLIIDPQKEELAWLEVGLELKFDDFKGGSAGGRGL